MNRPEAINEACVALEAAKARQTEPIVADINESEACAILAALPNVHWVWACRSAGWHPAHKNCDTDATCSCDARDGSGGYVASKNHKTMREAVAEVVAKWEAARVKAERERTIRERVEREMKEADAADAALKLTPTPQLCPHCQVPLSRLSASPECVPTCPFGCSESEHHHNIEHRQQDEKAREEREGVYQSDVEGAMPEDGGR